MEKAFHFDAFALLKLPRSIDLSEICVQNAYDHQIAACHPDHYTYGPRWLKRLAAERSVQLNEALTLLSAPIQRAAHWLALEGYAPNDPWPESLTALYWKWCLESDEDSARVMQKLDEDSKIWMSRLSAALKKAAWADALSHLQYLQAMNKLKKWIVEKQTTAGL